MTDHEAIRQAYPSIISSEQLRLILHVSKRRCVWLMKNNIPHTDNGRVMSREWLIDFFCGKAMRIVRKNEWHLELLRAEEYE